MRVFFMMGCDTGSIDESSTSPAEPAATPAMAGLFAAHGVDVSDATVTVFQPAGPAGADGVLEEGAMFPPTNGENTKIWRGPDYIEVKLRTSGLPPGAYTNWWVLINEPDACVPSTDPEFPDLVGDCGFDEVFDIGGPSTPSVFWATGGIVHADGVGHFEDRTHVGEAFGDPFPLQHLWGPGLTNPGGVMVFYIIKYHGPASDDPNELHAQISTLLGLCNEAANAYDDGNCFDPQWAIFSK